jgi:hypothetical protein
MGELEGTEAAFNQEEAPAIEEVPAHEEVEKDGPAEVEELEEVEEELEPEPEKSIDDEIDEELDKELEASSKEGRVDFAAIKKDFPELFKKHPEMRGVIFRDKEYTKLLGSVEEAKDVAEKSEIFDYLESSLNRGDSVPFVKSLSDSGIEKFATTILPALAERNPALIEKATKPLIMNVLRSMEREGASGTVEGKNIAAAGKIFKKFLFGGDYNIPKQDEQEPESIKAERQKLQEQQDRLWNEKVSEFREQRDSFTVRKLETLVSEKLGPTKELSPGARKAIIEKVIGDISERLANDKVHMSYMNSYMKRAAKAGFPRTMIGQQVDAYLARARHLVGSAVQSYRQDSVKKLTTGKDVPSGSPGSTKKIDSTKIDYRHTSTEDLFNNKVTYKK